MKHTTKGLAVIASSVVAVLGGYSGFASANTSVSTQGPNSGVSIYDNMNSSCSVNNNNNVNVSTAANQTASTGNANVGGGNWGAWNPSTWQSNGYSYEQWHSAFSGYMNSVHSNWGGSGGNTSGGNAMTGNASNNNMTNTMLNLTNGAGCGGSGGSGGTHVSTNGPSSGVGVVLNSSTNNSAQNNNNVWSSNIANQMAHTGSANVSGNTWGGSAHAGNSMNMNGTSVTATVVNHPAAHNSGGNGGGVQDSTPATGITHISTQGPGSGVYYTSTSNTNTSIVNSNNITTIATTNQTATTGDTNVSGNTSGGSASTGDAMNHNSTGTHFIVNN